MFSGDISVLVLPDDQRVRSIIGKSVLGRITLLIVTFFSYALYFREPRIKITHLTVDFLKSVHYI